MRGGQRSDLGTAQGNNLIGLQCHSLPGVQGGNLGRRQRGNLVRGQGLQLRRAERPELRGGQRSDLGTAQGANLCGCQCSNLLRGHRGQHATNQHDRNRIYRRGHGRIRRHLRQPGSDAGNARPECLGLRIGIQIGGKRRRRHDLVCRHERIITLSTGKELIKDDTDTLICELCRPIGQPLGLGVASKEIGIQRTDQGGRRGSGIERLVFCRASEGIEHIRRRASETRPIGQTTRIRRTTKDSDVGDLNLCC